MYVYLRTLLYFLHSSQTTNKVVFASFYTSVQYLRILLWDTTEPHTWTRWAM